MSESEKPVVTVAQAAYLAGVTRMTVYNWVRRGLLNVVDDDFGMRLAEDDVLALVKRRSAVLRRADQPLDGTAQGDTAGL